MALLLPSVFCPSRAAFSADLERLVSYEIRPSEANPAVSRFDEPNYVLFNGSSSSVVDLVLFLPGTRGKPLNNERLLQVVALQGYRVIGLSYNDSPAVVEVCATDPSPACSAAVREKRLFGRNTTAAVQNSLDESIVSRLVHLLTFLSVQHSDEHWLDYLRDGEPDWSRMVVSGLSQGAGMAAYLAKQKQVARVVLFSSPWDFYGQSHRLAPWISQPSVTPVERWFAEYHRRENTATLIQASYRALNIPPDHVRVFDLEVPPQMRARSENAYHSSTTKLPGYASEWRFLYGSPATDRP